MDTRKLKVSLGVNGQANIYLEDRGIMATMQAGYDKTREEDASELVHRWNAYPELVEVLRDFVRQIEWDDTSFLNEDAAEGEENVLTVARALILTLKA